MSGSESDSPALPRPNRSARKARPRIDEESLGGEERQKSPRSGEDEKEMGNTPMKRRREEDDAEEEEEEYVVSSSSDSPLSSARRTRSSRRAPPSPGKSEMKNALEEMKGRRMAAGAQRRRLYKSAEKEKPKEYVVFDPSEEIPQSRWADEEEENLDDFLASEDEEEDQHNDMESHRALLARQLESAHEEDFGLGDLSDGELLAGLNEKLDDAGAFSLWIFYLVSIMVDEKFSYSVEKDKKVRRRFRAAFERIEESFDEKRSKWVNSQLWDSSAREIFRDSLDSLPYVDSQPLGSAALSESCETCNRQHGAAFRLYLYGIKYRPEKIQHPFNMSQIIIHNKYEDATFLVGELCHQRIRLFHAMRHFKLHVILSLRFHMENIIKQLNQSGNKQRTIEETIRAEKDILIRRLTSGEKGRELHRYHFDIWRALNEFADEYTGDTRKSKIDLGFLREIQDFHQEACISTMMNCQIKMAEAAKPGRAGLGDLVDTREKEKFWDKIARDKKIAKKKKIQIEEDPEEERQQEIPGDEEVVEIPQSPAEKSPPPPAEDFDAVEEFSESEETQQRRRHRDYLIIQDSESEENNKERRLSVGSAGSKTRQRQLELRSPSVSDLLNPPSIRKSLIQEFLAGVQLGELEFLAQQMTPAHKNFLAAKLTNKKGQNRHK